ncbi:FAD-dependent oxidoreductase [Candidatus Uhrbacteria bacterium]|nr:FAD-dependent oxidoreductase [Candidatus Uhrbacteria bacterium]
MALNPVLVVRRFRVQEIKWETAETYTLVLAPEDATDMVAFKPGQWVYLHLFNQDGTPWAKAAYSIALAPEECSQRIELGIKLHGDFTKRASKLMPDDVVGVQGPFGVFVLPPGESPLVMFAGGIGVTPLRSMIRSLVKSGGSRSVTLFYSNKYVEESPYLEEFMALAESASWFRFIPTLTQQAPTDWKGERSRIDLAMLQKHAVIDMNTTYLMCGPRPFMESIRGFLKEAGIDVKKQLKEELFG